MFTLKIHTKSTVAGASNPRSKKNTFNPTELNGVVHLFRNLPFTSSSVNPVMTMRNVATNVATRTKIVFIVAVPNYLPPEEFVAFCGRHVDEFTDLCFIRNDSVEDRYSVLIKFANQAAADGFCISYHGKRFSPSENEVCHIYFAQLVGYTDSADAASIPQPGYIELPTCPVCLERLDHDTSAIQITHCDHSFQCPCISKRTYLSCQVCRLCQQHDGKPTCEVCGTSSNPWACLICGFVGCGRYEKGHAIEHYRQAQHCYSLGLETQQIWDYVGEKFAHRLNQSKVGIKSAVTNHQSKVGIKSAVSNHQSSEGECGDKMDDDEFSGALFSSKVDTCLSNGSIAGKSKMVQTRNSNESGASNPDQIATQLAAIVEKLTTMESDVAALKSKSDPKGKSGGGYGKYDEGGSSSWQNGRTRPYNKIDFPTFSDGDPRGWILKAEKYFRYYNIPEEERVDVASMHLEGDALDLFSWLSTDQAIEYWEELVQHLQKNFGPAEFHNPDEHLCSIRQTGTVQEYMQEFVKRSSRVTNWPEHCLLGVFLNGLKEDLKADVRIHKPRTVYKAMSIAFEFE